MKLYRKEVLYLLLLFFLLVFFLGFFGFGLFEKIENIFFVFVDLYV